MRRPFLILLLGLLCSVSFAMAKELNIVFIPKSNDQIFWDIMRSGVDDAIRETGNIHLTWRGPAYNDDTDSQIKILRMYTQPGVDAIIIVPTDRDRLVAPIKSAVELGIKVIVVDSALSGNYHQNFIATDNYHGGQLAAAFLSQQLSKQGRVILFRTVAGSDSTEERARGFLDYMKHNAPDIDIVSDIYGGGSKGKILHSATVLLKEITNIDGIFAVNESSSDGVLRALRKTGAAGKTKLVGFDSTDFLIDGLKKHDIDALIIQNPKQMGYLGIKAAVAAINKTPMAEKIIHTEVKVMTLDNYLTPDIKMLRCVHC